MVGIKVTISGLMDGGGEPELNSVRLLSMSAFILLCWEETLIPAGPCSGQKGASCCRGVRRGKKVCWKS
ncbi:hypothetical protein EYF80_007728 [Liparis tanakae]|uniref:Uncharacterized protein n=1 Tax=Liparis tanakae TaxID=230148 RepID=A0A4Z2IXR3_9TELE|nr:hypothetical protein EYF80_007728 [Liparis tanakae]